MVNKKSSPFDNLDIEKLKRFEEIISNENVDCNLKSEYLYTQRQMVSISVRVMIKGKDGKTNFSTSYCNDSFTFEQTISDFLEWWDREISRFNSFNELTQ